MCEPTTLFAIAGAGTAIAGNLAAVKTATARNKNIAKNHKLRIGQVQGDHLQNITQYYTRGVDYSIATDDATITANREINKYQDSLNNAVASLFSQSEELGIKELEDQRIGRAAESGNIDPRMRSVYGRMKAKGRSGLRQAIESVKVSKDEINWIRNKNINKAWRLIGNQPMMGRLPEPPVFDEGPSALQQMLSIGTGAMQGYAMGKSLQAPTVGKTPGISPQIDSSGIANVFDEKLQPLNLAYYNP